MPQEPLQPSPNEAARSEVDSAAAEGRAPEGSPPSVRPADKDGKKAIASGQPTAPASERHAGEKAAARTASAARKPPVVQPSAEQIAKWERRAFEPFQLLACFDEDATGFVTATAHTADGGHLIMAGSKLSIRSVAGAEAPQVLRDVQPSDSELFFTKVVVSPDGQWFATGNSAGLLEIWSAPDQKVLRSKQLYDNDIIEIAISPDSQAIATATHNNEVTIWSADTLEMKQRFMVASSGLKRLAYLSNERLVTAAETVEVWDVTIGHIDSTLSPGRYNYTLARSRAGKWFAFGEDQLLRLWDIERSERAGALLGTIATNELVEFSPDEQFLVTANKFETRLWDLASRQVVQVLDSSGPETVALNWLPESKLLLITTEDGCLRVWGPGAAGEALNLRPLHAAIALPDDPAGEPATPGQLLHTIDLRSFPLLPDAVLQAVSPTILTFETTASAEEAALFCRYMLGRSGWTEVVGEPAAAGSILLRKSGCSLSVSVSPSAENRTSVTLNIAGNVDLRTIPKCDAGSLETVYENEQVIIYRTDADLLSIEASLLRQLHAAGWTAFSRLHASKGEQEDARDLEFLRNSMILRVTVGKFPTDPNRYTVQYSGFLTTNSLPLPADSGFVEFDGSTTPHLVATTAMNLAEASDFYDRRLAAEGWLPRTHGRSIQDKHCSLPYIQGQRSLRVGLVRLDNGRTLVRVGDGLENSSWQLAKPDAAAAPASEQSGLEAADFPILDPKGPPKFDIDDKSLSFSMGTVPLLEVADKYTKEFESRGWTPQGSGIRADDYVFLTFAKGDAEIDLRARVSDGNAMLNVQGDGLLWTKPLPTGQQVISYETWLRRNRHPATLELLDKYQAEMRAIANAASGNP